MMSVVIGADDCRSALEPEGACLDPGSVLTQESLAIGGVVGHEQLADRFERDLKVPQLHDRPGGRELVAPVESIVRERVDPCRPEEVELVVMA